MADNPWLTIPAADYEGHMGPAGVGQLAPLQDIFARVYRELRPARVAVLGCGTGNGLDAIDPAVTERLVGVDLNPEYIALARRRHARLAKLAE
jgi:SAM-dependent methyltransferase